jgi:hypothetical protein
MLRGRCALAGELLRRTHEAECAEARAASARVEHLDEADVRQYVPKRISKLNAALSETFFNVTWEDLLNQYGDDPWVSCRQHIRACRLFQVWLNLFHWHLGIRTFTVTSRKRYYVCGAVC